MNSIKVCTIPSTGTLFLQVNSPGTSCDNPFTSGPCATEILTLISSSDPNPLVLTATARVTVIYAYYSDTTKTNMVEICIRITDGAVFTWYYYGVGGGYYNLWYSSASS